MKDLREINMMCLISRRAFNRRSATTLLVTSDRGLKPTATVRASLREDLTNANRYLLRTARILCNRQLELQLLAAFLALFLAACSSAAAADDGGLRAGVPASAPAAAEFFEKKIRPLLAEQCYKCH